MAVPVVASFEFAVSGGGGSATEVTVNKPSGVASGDLLILLVGNEDNTSTTSFAAITGWTKGYEFGNATPDTKIAMYWRVADGTEAASETIDWSATGGDFGGAWYLRVTGADTTAPIHLLGTPSQTSGATSQAASSITPTIDDTLVFAHHSFDGADGTHGVSGTNWPSAFPTDQFIFASVGDTAAWCGGWVTKDLASAGASNNCTFTSSTSDGMVQVQFAVAPGAGTNVLLADDVSSASAVTTPAIGQAHVLNADDVASVSSVSAPAIGQEHALTADDVASASSVTEPALALDIDIAATTDALALSEQTASISIDIDVAATTDALALTENSATVAFDVNVLAAADVLTLTEQSASISLDIDVVANTDALTLTERSATVSAGTNVQALTDALVLAPLQAAINVATNIQAGFDALALTANQASIVVGGDVDVQASTDALVLTENAAIVNAETNVLAGSAAQSLTEQQATISLGVTIAANTAAIVLLEFPVTLSFDRVINTATDSLTLSVHAASISSGSVTAARSNPPNQLLASKNDASFPLGVSVDSTGGVSGLAVVGSIRDVSDSASYLDFSDNTFKTSGWASKTKSLSDFGGGFYGTTLDISAITNLPSPGNHLAVEYNVTGSVASVASSMITIMRSNVGSNVWAEVLESTFTAQDLMKLISAALAGKLSGANTTNIAIRDLADTKDAISATVDEFGNRSSTILNP